MDGSGLLVACSLTGLQSSVTILRLLVVWRRFPSDRWERRLVWARKYELSTRTGLTVDQWELHRHWKILDLLVKKDRGSILYSQLFISKVFSIEYWLLRIRNLKNYEFKRIRITWYAFYKSNSCQFIYFIKLLFVKNLE